MLQDDSLVGVPAKLNRYRRAGTKQAEDAKKSAGEDGSKPAQQSAHDNSLEDSEGEGDVGGGAGLTLIKIRLFKEVKKDEASSQHAVMAPPPGRTVIRTLLLITSRFLVFGIYIGRVCLPALCAVVPSAVLRGKLRRRGSPPDSWSYLAMQVSRCSM